MSCTVIFLTLFSLSFGDPPMNWAKSEVKMFKNIPKHWFLFIKSFSEQSMKRITNEHHLKSSVIVCLRKYNHEAQALAESNSTLWFHENLRSKFRDYVLKEHEGKPNLFRKIHSFHFRHILTNTTGVALLNSSLQPNVDPLFVDLQNSRDGFTALDQCNPGHPERQAQYSQIDLIFKLCRFLCLNISIFSLKFRSGSVNFAGGFVPCDLGHLIIQHHRVTHAVWLFVSD